MFSNKKKWVEWFKRENAWRAYRESEKEITNICFIFYTGLHKIWRLPHTSGRKERISSRRQDGERSIAETSCSHGLDTLLQKSSKNTGRVLRAVYLLFPWIWTPCFRNLQKFKTRAGCWSCKSSKHGQGVDPVICPTPCPGLGPVRGTLYRPPDDGLCGGQQQQQRAVVQGSNRCQLVYGARRGSSTAVMSHHPIHICKWPSLDPT